MKNQSECMIVSYVCVKKLRQNVMYYRNVRIMRKKERWVLQMGNADQMSGLKGYLGCGKGMDACSLVYMTRYCA